METVFETPVLDILVGGFNLLQAPCDFLFLLAANLQRKQGR